MNTALDLLKSFAVGAAVIAAVGLIMALWVYLIQFHPTFSMICLLVAIAIGIGTCIRA